MKVTHRKGRGKKLPITTVSCSCCVQKVVIEHNEHLLEINGVPGTIAEWREILLPLLGLKKHISGKGCVSYLPVKTQSDSKLMCIDQVSECKPQKGKDCSGCGG